MNFHELLKSDFKRFNTPELNFHGESNILITGSGGSIGSEISRQALRGNPRNLYILDASEFALFNILNDLEDIARNEEIKTKIHPLLVNLCDKKLLNISLSKISFNFIFHAAAYKHVNMLQINPLAAFRNNVLGTNNLLEVTKENTSNFILISTDKAVNPVNIMGLSKNLCEKVVKSFSDTTNICNYNIVRFGNVLHSSGSVIPIFQNQISNKLPVTVTDKLATRYFMTIPEAVSLVLSASSIRSNGSVYVLDMGEPVKILDLAIHMIMLAGKSPTYNEPVNDEIKIEFIGIRDGEKIDEQLTNGELQKLDIDGVYRANEVEDYSVNIKDVLSKIDSINSLEDLEPILETLSYG